MKVRCIGNYGSMIPKEIRGNFCGEDTYFPVKIGQLYSVYAMGNSVGSPILQYLVADHLGFPRYCPSDLFEITDHSLPEEFGFTEWKDGTFHYRMWGYHQILNYDHYEGLIELRSNDIEIFSRVRLSIDSQFSGSSCS